MPRCHGESAAREAAPALGARRTPEAPGAANPVPHWTGPTVAPAPAAGRFRTTYNQCADRLRCDKNGVEAPSLPPPHLVHAHRLLEALGHELPAVREQEPFAAA